MYGTLPAAAGWQHLVQKVAEDIGLLCSSNCPCGLGHSSRELDMVVHGDDFIVAGCGADLDWLSQKHNEKFELVQKARLGPGHDSEATVLNRCVTYNDSGLTWEADPRQAELAVAELGLQKSRRTQAAPSRMHHLTTKNWSLTDRKPTTACQQDWHMWHQTDPASHSRARNAAAQSGKQPVLTSHV